MTDPFEVLRRVMQPRQRPPAGEVCEMCGERVPADHGHVASIGERRLLCACRPCYLLFTREGAGARRLRAVPQRFREAGSSAFTRAQWERLAIPVDVVFLFRQSDAVSPDGPSRVVACYPGPAGATESELDLAAWPQLVAGDPVLGDVEPDVEAVLVRRLGPDEFRCLVVPIDACYQLVGLTRRYWAGFGGGEEVWARFDAFFDDAVRRANPAGAGPRR